MTGTGYRRKDNKRACSLCGHVWHMSDMTYRGLGRYYCPDDAAGLTAEEINRHNSRAKPLLIKNAKAPLHQTENSDYLMSEAAIFRAVKDNAGVRDVIDQNGALVTSWLSALVLGEAGVYMADVATDASRQQLTSVARTKLLALADVGIQKQLTFANILFGGVNTGAGSGPGGIFRSADTARCGQMFLKAYATSGAAKYITGADRCATFLRRMQRLDVDPSFPTTERIGGFAANVDNISGQPSSDYTQAEAFALDFLNDLRAVRGGSYVVGDTSLGIAASLDTIISEAMGFYFDGAFHGTPLFSATLPYYKFSAGPSGTNTFSNLTTTGGVEYNVALDVAGGVRALYDMEGYTARVAAFMTWLRGFTGYDTDFAPSFNLAVRTNTYAEATPSAAASAPAYGLAAAARLAPVTIAAGRSLRELKDATASKARLTADSVDANGGKNGVGFPYAAVYPGPTGRLAFDMTAPRSTISVLDAAVFGGIYRYAPRAIGAIA